MYIGQLVQSWSWMNPGRNRTGIFKTQGDLPFALKQALAARCDRVEIKTRSQADANPGIYAPPSNRLEAFDPIPYTKLEPDENLKKELLPPSERGEYTEEDALLDQYSKQYRIDGYIDGDKFILNSSGSVRLMGDVSKEELENFRQELIKKGLGTEIDWRGVQGDFVQIGINFGNAERFEQKADYLASRYAVLKDRIQTQFTGDKREAELQKLEQIYTEAKEEMADSYAENIGGFYEDLGQAGAADDMRESVLAVIDGKAEEYLSYLEQNDIYADITDPEKQWLKQDDGYMAQKLRNSVASTLEQTKTEHKNVQMPYSEKDLAYAGKCAQALAEQLKEPDWDIEESDSDLGRHLAKQYGDLKDSMENTGISSKLSDMIKDSFEPFIEKFMDALDAKISRRREWVSNPKYSWQAGLIRTSYINRESVWRAFHNAAF